MQITINLTDEQIKILETDIADIKEWINNFIRTKVRQTAYSIMWEKGNKRPDRMTETDLITEVAKMNLEKAIDRNKDII